MKRLLLTILLLCTTAFLFSPPVHASIQMLQPDAPPTDPEAVLRAINAASTVEEVQEVMAFYADDAVQIALPPPPGTNGVFIGKDLIQSFQEEFVTRNGQVEFTDIQVDGERVTWEALVVEDVFRDLGVFPIQFSGAAVIQDGLVRSEMWIMSEQSVAQLAAAEQRLANKELIRRFYDELWNQGDLAVADEIVAADFADGFAGQNGVEGLKETVMLFRTAFPEMEISYDDMVAEGDLVVVTITNNMGSYQGGLGDIFGVPDSAIGMEVVLHGIDYARIQDGKIAAGWGVHDDLGWLQQFGLALEPVAGE